MRCGLTCYHKSWDIFCERGGGSKPQPPQVIPPPPAPDVGKTADEAFQAQLKYNPGLTKQSYDLSSEYGPKYAQMQYDLQSQYGPMYQALIEKQFPQFATLSQQTKEGLANPSGLSNVQQQAQDAVRQRAYDASSKGVRESANVGGTLFGGHSQLREDRARNELAQGFATQDIQLQQQQRAQTMQELLSLFQAAGLQVQQPNVPQFGQSVVPGGDNLYNALVQNNGNFGVIPGTQGSPSPLWGLGGQAAGAAGSIGAAKMFVMCLPSHTLIDTEDGSQTIESLEAGDEITGGKVLFKTEYAPQETIFVKFTLSDGRSVESCDLHLIEGKPASSYSSGDELSGSLIIDKQITVRNERTYDLLTTSHDGGYFSQGISIATMIPTLHKIAKALEAV